MSEAEKIFIHVAANIQNAEKSQMFGKSCFKINNKAFVCFFQECMVFKLNGNKHAEALALGGSLLFDPSGKQRPMKEWVQVSVAHSSQWKDFATAAYEYVLNSR